MIIHKVNQKTDILQKMRKFAVGFQSLTPIAKAGVSIDRHAHTNLLYSSITVCQSDLCNSSFLKILSQSL